MNDNRLDDLSKALASQRSRRGVLKVLFWFLAGGGAAASTARVASAQAIPTQPCNPPPPAAQPQVIAFCNASFPPAYSAQAGACISQGMCGQGPAAVCGPGAPAGHPDICQGACCPPATPKCCLPSGCVNTQTNVNNCGTCGNVCAAGSGCCGGGCTNRNTVQNCSTC